MWLSDRFTFRPDACGRAMQFCTFVFFTFYHFCMEANLLTFSLKKWFVVKRFVDFWLLCEDCFWHLIILELKMLQLLVINDELDSSVGEFGSCL